MGYRHLTRLLAVVLFIQHILLSETSKNIYTNEWAVEIEGGDLEAQEIANRYGFRVHGRVCIQSSIL